MRGVARKLAVAAVAGLAGVGGAVGIGVGAASAGSSSSSTLTGGQTMTAGQQLESADGHFELTMQADGNLVLYLTENQRPLWASNTVNNPGAYALLEPDGDLNVFSSSNTVLWSDNASTPGCPSLDVLTNGTVGVYGPSGAVWQGPSAGPMISMVDGDELQSGQVILSPNDDFELAMQSDGNLVVENTAGTVLWQTNTQNNPGAYAGLGSDGDFGVYSAGGSQLWAASSNGAANDHLYMQNDGNLVLYDPGAGPNTGASYWASGTSGAPTGGGSFAPTPALGSSSACSTPSTPVATVTVTAPTSTAVTVAASSHAPKALRVPVAFDWAWRGSSSFIRRISTGRMPGGVTWTAEILPAHPSRHDRALRRTAADARQRVGLIRWLEHRRYGPGESVVLVIDRRGYISQRNVFRIRLHHTPDVLGQVVTKKTKKGRR